MDRRELVRALGATAALGFVPRSVEAAAGFASALHTRVADLQGFRTLSGTQQALVSRVADLIIPRTDTPGALDVRVPELIDLLLTEWYHAGDAESFLANLNAIDDRAKALGGRVFTELSSAQQVELLTALDAARGDTTGAAVGFREIKSLTVVGYFTSERVSKDILRTRTFFSRYQGDAPVGA